MFQTGKTWTRRLRLLHRTLLVVAIRSSHTDSTTLPGSRRSHQLDDRDGVLVRDRQKGHVRDILSLAHCLRSVSQGESSSV